MDISNDLKFFKEIHNIFVYALNFFQKHDTWESVERYNNPTTYNGLHGSIGQLCNTKINPYDLVFGYLLNPAANSRNSGKSVGGVYTITTDNKYRILFLVLETEDITNFDKNFKINLGSHQCSILVHEIVHMLDEYYGIPATTNIFSVDETGDSNYNITYEFRAYFYQGLLEAYFKRKKNELHWEKSWYEGFVNSLNMKNLKYFELLLTEIKNMSLDNMKLLVDGK